tara:strand:+ start:314 stop:514 length:201 start_codon:yes stop_codon:yes gene_type:complete
MAKTKEVKKVEVKEEKKVETLSDRMGGIVELLDKEVVKYQRLSLPSVASQLRNAIYSIRKAIELDK